MPHQMNPGSGVIDGPEFAPNYEWLVGSLDKFDIKSVAIDLAAEDPDSDPTTLLRSGLVMGRITASGYYTNYDNGAGDGSEVAAAILLHPVTMLDKFGNALAAVPLAAVVLGGRIKSEKCYVNGDTLDSDAAALGDLRTAGFKIDEDTDPV